MDVIITPSGNPLLDEYDTSMLLIETFLPLEGLNLAVGPCDRLAMMSPLAVGR